MMMTTMMIMKMKMKINGDDDVKLLNQRNNHLICQKEVSLKIE